jgi:ABC-type sugar transport system ATPase subunit
LIKCISGVYNSDEGEIKIKGEVVEFVNPE